MATENIEGTATDPNGNTLQDAVIALFLTNKNANDGDLKNVKYTRTDSNGVYSIDDHPDADGTSQEWHVAGYYQDGTGEFNALSKPSVEGSVGAAIPDSGDLHARYDWSDKNTTTSTVPDLTGNNRDLTGEFTEFRDINGVQAGYFDGVDDLVDTTDTSVSFPFHLFAVFTNLETSTSSTGYTARSSENSISQYYSGGNGYALYNGSSEYSGDLRESGDILLISVLWDNPATMRINETEYFTSDVGTLSTSLDDFVVGTGGGSFGNANSEAKFGEILIYNKDKSNTLHEIEQYLIDKWGPVGLV